MRQKQKHNFIFFTQLYFRYLVYKDEGRRNVGLRFESAFAAERADGKSSQRQSAMNAEKESISGRPDERTADATSVPALIKRAAQLEPNLGQVQPPHYPPSPGAPGQQPTEATVGNGHGLVGPSMVGDMTGGVSPVLAQNQGALALAGAKGVEHLAGGIKDGGALDTAGKAVQKVSAAQAACRVLVSACLPRRIQEHASLA